VYVYVKFSSGKLVSAYQMLVVKSGLLILKTNTVILSLYRILVSIGIMQL